MENFSKLVGKEANENFPKALEEKTKPFMESILGFLNPDQASSLNSQLNSIMGELKKDILKSHQSSHKIELSDEIARLNLLFPYWYGYKS